MAGLIEQFQRLQEDRRSRRLGQMAEFITEFEIDPGNLNCRCPASFNLFSVLGLEGDEVKHTRFLTWLLDPNRNHGQRTLFLRGFIEECCRLDLPVGDSDRFRIRAEYDGLESIIDLMIYSQRKFLIFLENKVYAAEGTNQVDREFRDLRRLGEALRIPESHQRAIFLTPDGRKPTSGDASHWQTLSYEKVAETFRTLLPEITAPKVKCIVSDWLDAISTLGREQ
jgi:hypothetical protein